jgi:hypothetical protein
MIFMYLDEHHIRWCDADKHCYPKESWHVSCKNIGIIYSVQNDSC